MDPSNFDEFGNYIGPELSDSDEVSQIRPTRSSKFSISWQPIRKLIFAQEEAVVDEEEDNQGGGGTEDLGEHSPGDVQQDVGQENGFEPDNQIVLHEDKKYYPSAEEVYGKETETLVMEEDAQPLEVCTMYKPAASERCCGPLAYTILLQVPIIAPVKQRKFQVQEQEAKTIYSSEFLTGLMGSPLLSRNVAIAGHLHHGKTVVTSLH